MTLDKLKVIARELVEGFTDPELLEVIALAESRVSGLTCNQELASAYLSAHILALSTRPSGEAGSVGAKKEGQLSINYSPGLNKDSYDQTAFGREFKVLVAECIIPMTLAVT